MFVVQFFGTEVDLDMIGSMIRLVCVPFPTTHTLAQADPLLIS